MPLPDNPKTKPTPQEDSTVVVGPLAGAVIGGVLVECLVELFFPHTDNGWRVQRCPSA